MFLNNLHGHLRSGVLAAPSSNQLRDQTRNPVGLLESKKKKTSKTALQEINYVFGETA